MFRNNFYIIGVLYIIAFGLAVLAEAGDALPFIIVGAVGMIAWWILVRIAEYKAARKYA